MAYEQRNNNGSLFKNDKKEKDTHPDYRGKCVVNGEEMEIAAWIKTSPKGVKYMSLAFSEPYQKEERPEQKDNKPADDDFAF